MMSNVYVVYVSEYEDKTEDHKPIVYSVEIFSEDEEKQISYARGAASIADAAYDAFKGVEL
jgi:hypothetical protein